MEWVTVLSHGSFFFFFLASSLFFRVLFLCRLATLKWIDGGCGVYDVGCCDGVRYMATLLGGIPKGQMAGAGAVSVCRVEWFAWSSEDGGMKDCGCVEG